MEPIEFTFTIPLQTLLLDSQPKPQPVPKLELPDRLLRLDTVMLLTGLSRATLWRMQREGRFPKRVKIGKRAIAWRESEIRDWLAQP